MHWAPKSLIVVVAGVVLGLAATWITVVHGEHAGRRGGRTLEDQPCNRQRAERSLHARPVAPCMACSRSIAPKRSITRRRPTTAADALDGDCRYEIAGRDPDTRWWSVTAYGADDFLIPNSANRYSMAKTTVAAKERWEFQNSGRRPERHQTSANWIPTVQRRLFADA